MTLAANEPYHILIDSNGATQTVFVTSQAYGVDFEEAIPPFPQLFGSVTAADYHCTNIANQRGLLDQPWDQNTLYFRAMLTETLVDLPLRTSMGDQPYVNINGDVVANDRDALFGGVFIHPILNDNGLVVTGANVPIWTGATASGAWSGMTCDQWSNPAAAPGSVGNLNANGPAFLNNGTRACHLGARLVCVGVRQTPWP